MKRKSMPIAAKLWQCFVLFAAVILGALWLLQTVFLQSLYTRMQARALARVADGIARACDSADLANRIDEMAYQNAVLIFIADAEGNVLYSVDEYSTAYRVDDYRHSGKGGMGRGALENAARWQISKLRSLPSGFAFFMRQLENSENGVVCYEKANESDVDGSTLIYGRRIAVSRSQSDWLENGNAIVYVQSPLGAVGSAVEILRWQLLAVTAAALLLGGAIAALVAKRFSKPIAALAERSRRMVSENEAACGAEFPAGFCRELDALSDTLRETAARLTQVERLRRELLANVSHDLRTPLTMIKGYAEMIRDVSWRNHAEEAQDLAVIIREADRLNLLVNDILDYSALQSGGARFAKERVNLSALAARVAERFAPLCAREGIRIETALAPEGFVTGDERRLEQVLYNFLANAAVHAGKEGVVSVALARKGDRFRLEVTDRGDGIPADELPHIWERYFTSRQRRRSDAGTGLGLAISRQILTEHGAGYGVESEVGKGSTFWFELAAQDASLPA